MPKAKKQAETDAKTKPDTSSETNVDTPITVENTSKNTLKPIDFISKPVIPSVTVTVDDLEKEQVKAKKMMLARELLENGYSVRDVVANVGLKKSLVAKASKNLRSTTKSKAKSLYMEKPFEDALKKTEEESLLGEGWMIQTYRRLLKMKLEYEMMSKLGLIGGSGANGSTSKIDINGLLFAKALGGGGNKEILELLGAMKNLGFMGQSDNSLENFSKYSELQDKGVERYKDIQQKALATAQAQSQKTLIENVASKAIEIGSKLVTQPRIPNPSPVNSPIPEPAQIEAPSSLLPSQEAYFHKTRIGSLENLTLPKVENPTVQDSSLGFSNLEKFARDKAKGGK